MQAFLVPHSSTVSLIVPVNSKTMFFFLFSRGRHVVVLYFTIVLY